MPNTPGTAKLRKLAQTLIDGRASRGEWALCFAVALNPSSEPRGRRLLADLAGLDESNVLAAIRQARAHGILTVEDIGGDQSAGSGKARFAVQLSARFIYQTGGITPPLTGGVAHRGYYTPAPDTGGITPPPSGGVIPPLGPGTPDATRALKESSSSKKSIKPSSTEVLPKELNKTPERDADSDESAALAGESSAGPKAKGRRATKGRRGIVDPRVASAFERGWDSYAVKVNPVKCAELFAAIPESDWLDLAAATRNYVRATSATGDDRMRQRRDPERFLGCKRGETAPMWRDWVKGDPRKQAGVPVADLAPAVVECAPWEQEPTRELTRDELEERRKTRAAERQAADVRPRLVVAGEDF
jgi:hypothetical protein